MSQPKSKVRISSARLILVPSLVSLAVTLLRLTGELRHWSARWFSTETGGTTPQGVSWVFGITWLAAPFGIYFAVRLVKNQEGPKSLPKALLFASLGLLMFVGYRIPISVFPFGFPAILIPLWIFMATAAALQYFGWPALFRTLLLYGLASRIPVTLVMLLAMIGKWGTHYDYVGMPGRFDMPLVPKFLWLAFFPQLIFWVAFTIVAGAICGALTAALIRFKPGVRRPEV
jgi:hypothetical protein